MTLPGCSLNQLLREYPALNRCEIFLGALKAIALFVVIYTRKVVAEDRKLYCWLIAYALIFTRINGWMG